MQVTNLYELKKIQTEFPKTKIKSITDSEKFIRQFYGDDMDIFESVFILLISQSNETLGYAKISQGGIASSIVDVRLVAKYAIDSLCSGVILAHNHPSGDANPSETDIKMTKKVKNALKLFNIDLLDHLILTSSIAYSFAANDEL